MIVCAINAPHPSPPPLGEVAEHREAGEGFLYPLSQKSEDF